MKIGDSQPAEFEEAYYLAQYPDVANAVKAGNFRTGLDHYLMVGRSEGRAPGRHSDIPVPANAGSPRELEIRPTGVDGKSLEDLLVFAVKRRFEPLLRKYLEDNSAAVMDNAAPHFHRMLDETLPGLLDGAVRAEVDRVVKAQETTRS